MDPFTEQRLREEVIYLHSLWHQGPPRPRPSHPPTPVTQQLHNPLNPPQFKRRANKPKPKKTHMNMAEPPVPLLPLPSQPSGGIEWPIEPTSGTTSSECTWPEPKPKSIPKPHLPCPRAQAQDRALKKISEFFSNFDAKEDNVDCVEEDDEEDDEEEDEEDGSDLYGFFLKVLMDDEELRECYERNSESGELSCLVCCGVGKKVWKRFKGSAALVQHSITIAKTKKRRAHRAYGQAICKALGWDIDRLPSFVLSVDNKLGDSENKPKEGEALMQANNVDGGVESGTLDNANSVNGDNCAETEKDRELILSEEPSKVTWPSPSSAPNVEWPCQSPSAPTSGWPKFNSQTDFKPHVLSPEEQMRLDAYELQQRASKLIRKFFVKSSDDEDDDGDDDDDDGDDEGDDDEEKRDPTQEEGCDLYNFFLKVFMEDKELREFYEKNVQDGDFSCLVCAGVGKKVWKRFKGCVALVQHSVSIAKTKKMRAHRAYGQAICKVLDWEVDRFPSIVSLMDDKLGKSVNEPAHGEGLAEGSMATSNADCVNGGGGQVLPAQESIPGETFPHDGASAACEEPPEK